MFGRGKAISKEKAAKSFALWIQLYYSSEILKIVKKQGENPEEAAVLGLFHGIALLFWELEKAIGSGMLTQEKVLDLKIKTIEYLVNSTSGNDKLSEDGIKSFTIWIYDLYDKLGLTQYTEEEEAIEHISTSICEMSGITKEKSIRELTENLHRYFSRLITTKKVE